MMRQMRALWRDRRGAALPIMAAGLLPVLAGIGAAIDIGRIVVVRAQMQAGVDAGALAGARVFGLADNRDQQVTAYFQANMPDGYAGADPIEPSSVFDEVQGVNRVSVIATTDLPLVFMRLFGISTTTISVRSVAEMQPKPLEVMVVLDDTGSMDGSVSGGGTRMAALRTAMYDFVDILHQGENRRADLAMGIITYTVTTNVGAILRDAGVAIQERDGFTNIEKYTAGATAKAVNALSWRGCVENDPTVRDLNASATTMEAGAWDIDKVLPGEQGRPGVRPYHVMPVTTTKPASSAYATVPRLPANYEADFKNNSTANDRKNNLYRLSVDGRTDFAQTLANAQGYRQHFYDFYIGLNYDTSSVTDDVIVREADGGYYDPKSTDRWKVDYTRIPHINATNQWSNPNEAYGYPTRGGRNLRMPTPNWQCPEPGLNLAYNQPKSVYDDYIRLDNYPVMPADGTLHHIGMLWGYRLLTRDDVFKRTNPVPSETPMRALVFMTDGESNANLHAAWYGAYGNMREKRISSSDSNIGAFKNQVMYRFAKVCENAKRDKIKVFIVSLGSTSTDARNVFNTCAGSNFLETTTRSQIQNAFRQIAVDLVDLHLTK